MIILSLLIIGLIIYTIAVLVPTFIAFVIAVVLHILAYISNKEETKTTDKDVEASKED